MNEVIIGLGSNIQPNTYMKLAISRLQAEFVVRGVSKIVVTKPVGFVEQADFHNNVVMISTSFTQEELTQWLKKTETELGRVRSSNKWGPRSMDMDILVWNGKIVDNDVYDRDFLQQSILEVKPGLQEAIENPP
jgi:2-amino-4-hydroxy-6-hydroxymethyldihydropteridine diphosphokinase